ncbi:PREDICTED: putative leucine-rich repeat-containing protein DDB_G0290503 [Dufourea novaeangliae]|uniref:THAP domain-containing protein 2 n=1 Tax=Dufourea novaeangliae TaxID=178035 RepID=A0A154P7X0_DUFNO|nr:PREDICTED: putative leucine-rich repeat-containing protein DDB_G0290503 [Dufourea novaeangliae]KZC08026.1 THAP domain-containing protein 2 [Dufourea novaeangliae]
MPGCAAVGCNNRSEKGYIMKCFPRDPKLRKIWQERVARADWEPSNNSFLCHVHFEPQEWSITQTGRIRLRKNAVPSIFTVTSTRKSPKKRTQIINIKDENLSQSECSVEYMEVDTEHSSTGHIEEKDSDSQDVCETSVQSVKNTFKHVPKSVKEGDEQEESVSSDANKKIVVMIAEDNVTDGSSIVKQDNHKIKLNDRKKEAGLSLTINNSENTLPSTVVKKEVKLEVMDHHTFEDSYDEIEEKLKQICDGGLTEDDNYKNNEKNKLSIKSYKEDDDVVMIGGSSDLKNGEQKVTTSVNTDHGFPSRNEVGHSVADKEENVEIIFGTESGDEKMPESQIISKVNTANDNTLQDQEVISIKDEKKVFNEDIEENFSKDEVHVIPNIRAAMKRKRRTREEIMKSIKKSIRSISDADINSSSNSELSDTDTRNDSPLFSQEMKSMDKRNMEIETTKFVIKVTGDPDDVSEIIEELSSNTIETQKLGTFYKNEENNEFVTSVITVLSPKNPTEVIYSNFSSPLSKDEYVTVSKNELTIHHSPCEENQFTRLDCMYSSNKSHSSCLKHACFGEENKHHTQIKPTVQSSTQNTQTTQEKSDRCISSDHEELLEKIQIQEDVIEKLIDQLIIYKELENNRRNMSIGQDSPAKEFDPTRIYTRSSNNQSPALTKKVIESKQRLIEDLSNRVNYFEEMNKKLMKTVTLESQQKRKLEGQIRQKDNRIKELNWKLEKASKYLERAEKNTNTYRRKMLNMQTIMRRRKLLDEKMSKFNEMLIDSSKQEFSEKALVMAADIRKTCGRNGYDKLLSYGFPLPPLPSLRKGILNEDTPDPSKSDVEKIKNNTKLCVKVEKAQDIKDESTADKNNSEVPDPTAKTGEFDGVETVTGTVQDIFEENNDGDDFSTNELREHFILQLNAVM